MANSSSSWAFALATLSGCFSAVPAPPTTGYGAPYHGTGEGIYVKDSRTDWAISEGGKKIGSEQALEAAGDEEYETRRQIAKSYNDGLYREGTSHHRRAYRLIGASAAAIVVGFIADVVLAPALQNETIMPASAAAPESRAYRSGFAATGTATLGGLLIIGGLVGIPYAYYGGSRPPPYHEWHTPDALNRPAYVRQQTEPYNEKIGAPSLPDAAPAQLKVQSTPDRHIPRPRGGR